MFGGAGRPVLPRPEARRSRIFHRARLRAYAHSSSSRSNHHNIHPERLGALDHRVVKAENALCAQAYSNGKVKRIARSQLQSVLL